MARRQGAKARAFVKRAKAAQRAAPERVEVGFFPESRYPNGRPVASVAAIHEFGHELPHSTIPERAFMRIANAAAVPDLREVLRRRVDPRTMAVDDATAEALGGELKDAIEQSIDRLDDPANSPATQKRGSDPLKDSKRLRRSVRYRVEH